MSVQTLPTQTQSASEIISYDPATGREIGRAPMSSTEDVERAVARARAAQPAWAKHTFRERGHVILKARRIMLDESEEIAQLVSRETGKPATEALSMEIVPTLDAMHYFAHASEDLLRTTKDRHRPIRPDGPFVSHFLQTAWRDRNHFTVEFPSGHARGRNRDGADGR